MKYLLIIPVVLFYNSSIAQVLFNNTYSKPLYDYGEAVIERNDGKYLIAGSSSSQPNADYGVNILLVDSIGNLIWDKFLGNSGVYEFAYFMIETKDNNYLISGRDGNSDSYLAKFNSEGNLIWSKSYMSSNYETAYSVGETADSNYIFVSLGNAHKLYKINSNGDSIWAKTLNSAVYPSVIQTIDGGFALAGYVPIIGPASDIAILKLNSNGDSIWSKVFPQIGDQLAVSIIELPDSGLLIAASYNPEIVDGGYNTYLIRTNSVGDTIWTKTLSIANAHYIKKCRNNDGFILSTTKHIIFSFPFPDEPEDYLGITKLDTAGNIEWSHEFPGTVHTFGNNIEQTSDGGFLLTGNIVTSNLNDIILIKLDSIGNFVTSINETSFKNTVQISTYPNPFSNQLFISGDIPVYIRLFNTFGQTVVEASNTNQLNVSSIANGLYLLQIFDNKGVLLKTEKVVKE